MTVIHSLTLTENVCIYRRIIPSQSQFYCKGLYQDQLLKYTIIIEMDRYTRGNFVLIYTKGIGGTIDVSVTPQTSSNSDW